MMQLRLQFAGLHRCHVLLSRYHPVQRPRFRQLSFSNAPQCKASDTGKSQKDSGRGLAAVEDTSASQLLITSQPLGVVYTDAYEEDATYEGAVDDNIAQSQMATDNDITFTSNSGDDSECETHIPDEVDEVQRLHTAYITKHTEPRTANNPLLHEMWEPWARMASYVGKNIWPSSSYMWRLRDEAISKYSFAVPSHAALEACITHSGGKLLEVGSGLGYWASLLEDMGADVVAVDNGSWFGSEEQCFTWTAMLFKDTIIMDGVEYLRSTGGSPDRALLLCWPLLADELLEEYMGDTLIVVGERTGGCTWWPDEECSWVETLEVEIPTWSHIHDCLAVFKRKTP